MKITVKSKLSQEAIDRIADLVFKTEKEELKKLSKILCEKATKELFNKFRKEYGLTSKTLEALKKDRHISEKTTRSVVFEGGGFGDAITLDFGFGYVEYFQKLNNGVCEVTRETFDKFSSMKEKIDDLSKRKSKLKSLIRSFSSSAKLLKEVPEMANYVQIESQSSAIVPISVSKEIKELIGGA